MMHWPSIQKDKASISTGLRRAGICQSLGAALKLQNVMAVTEAPSPVVAIRPSQNTDQISGEMAMEKKLMFVV
jgi:hypothetical protein